MYKQAIVNELCKYAGMVGDQIRGGISNSVSSFLAPGVSTVAGVGGSIHGLLDGNDSLEDIEKGDKSPLLAYIPGVTSYRNSRRLAVIENKLSKKKHKRKGLSEILGPLTSTALATGAGAGIGSLVPFKNERDRQEHALKGAIIGSGVGLLGNVLGLGAGILSPGRSEEDQEKYYERSSLPNYLIPGLSTFNQAKGIGLSNRMVKKLKKERNKKKDED